MAPAATRPTGLTIDEDRIVAAAVPGGSRFKGYQDFLVQNLVLRPHVTRLRRERWLIPDGRTITAPMPAGIGGHFGPALRRFVLFQHHQGQVTVPRLVTQLTRRGIAISKRQVVRLLNAGQDGFLTEAQAVLRVGLATASWISVDDTGARHGNHPADSVNWWDASAFCHWLGARFGFKVRLPTEYEWQLAATGGNPARTYPWDSDWDPEQEPWRANTSESELGRSTAVGMYPAGASPAGILDMVGTVWEWCLNAFDDPDNTAFPVSQEDRHVVRGGSWDDYQDDARSACRSGVGPVYRLNFIGFRVVCSSTSFCLSGPGMPPACPPTTVCGPRQGRKDGAGVSRPHG